MAKKPDDRYQSAGEFAKAIQAVTTGVHRKPSVPRSFRQSQMHPTKSTTAHPASTSREWRSHPRPSSNRQHPNPAPAMTTPPPRKSEARLSPSTSHPDPLLKKRFIIPVWGWMVSAAVIFLLSLVIILWSQGVFPFNPSSGSLLKPNNPINRGNPTVPDDRHRNCLIPGPDRPRSGR